MYIIVRLVLACAFLVCSVAAIKRSKAIHKNTLYVVSTSISVMLVVASAFLPFENFFVTFSSPKAVYEYYTLEKPNIQLVVEGDNGDLIIDRQSEADTYLIIPKTVDGWKIGIGANTKRIIQKVSNGIIVYAYQYKSTNDYFITILDTNGGESTVSDECGTSFFSLEKYDKPLGKTFVTYYAHITDLNPQYSVTVNDNRIALKDQ